MIDTIIFDIGNVLAKFTWEETYRKILNEDEFNKISKATVLNKDAWNMLDKGDKNFHELIEIFSKDIPELKDKIIEAFYAVYEDIIPYSYSKDWVKSYRDRGYKIYILSNYGEKSFELSKPRFDFLNYVDGMLISYEEKLIKPSLEIYAKICEKYNITPENAVFIDDNEDNTNAAQKFGINAVLFENYEKAISDVENIINQN